MRIQKDVQDCSDCITCQRAYAQGAGLCAMRRVPTNEEKVYAENVVMLLHILQVNAQKCSERLKANAYDSEVLMNDNEIMSMDE